MGEALGSQSEIESVGMASTSAVRAGDGAAGRIRKAATALASDNQPLIAVISPIFFTFILHFEAWLPIFIEFRFFVSVRIFGRPLTP